MSALSVILSSVYLLIGSGVSSDKEGIRVYEFDEETATTVYVSGVKGLSNPSFFSSSRNGKFVYAVGESGEEKSTASSLSFDKKEGRLELLNTQQVHASGPCNIILTPREDFVYTSNYFGGSLTQLRVLPDGRLGETELVPFSGSSIVPDRQDKPYLHAVNFTPDKRFLMANDLGTDKIHVFPLCKATATNSPLDKKNAFDVDLKPGMGPRHLCWSPDGKMAYVIGELSGEVSSIQYKDKKLTVVQTIMADEFNGAGSADIHISPDGRFVYASHRLKGDGISIMEVQPDGTLRKVGYKATGVHPRNFTLSPDGHYVLVACRDDGRVEIYKRDTKTGLLSNTGRRIDVPTPLCLKWIEK